MSLRIIDLPKENECILEENGDTRVHDRLLCKRNNMLLLCTKPHLNCNIYFTFYCIVCIFSYCFILLSSCLIL